LELTVVVIGAEPDGLNINTGYGSTRLEHLQSAVVSRGADLSIAHRWGRWRWTVSAASSTGKNRDHPGSRAFPTFGHR
jgi:hypothetical protein